MVDYFALAITHLLLALTAWRLIRRDDLDCDPADSTARSVPRSKPDNA